MILATALAHGASRLYTNDSDFKTLANLVDDPIDIMILDKLDLQGEQFSLNLPDTDPDE